jgi:hypothetical protein
VHRTGTRDPNSLQRRFAVRRLPFRAPFPWRLQIFRLINLSYGEGLIGRGAARDPAITIFGTAIGTGFAEQNHLLRFFVALRAWLQPRIAQTCELGSSEVTLFVWTLRGLDFLIPASLSFNRE